MAHFTKMISMAKTPEQVNKEVSSMSAPVSASAENVEKYPYGLCVTLQNEQLEKLNLDGECEVGDTIHLCCMAKVTSQSNRETEGKTERRIELQITDLAIENEDGENAEVVREAKAKHRYGGGDEED